MTDRYNCLTVTLVNDMREDDADALINAICTMKGVLSVHGNVTNPSEFSIQTKERIRLANKLNELSHDILEGK